jgi:membrane protein required for colicin V production
MNYIDLFILVLLVFAIYRGYTRGFIMQLSLLAALVIGIFTALKMSGFTARLIIDHVQISGEALYLISVGITFALVFVGVNLLGRVIEKIVESAELSSLNRILGAVFGMAKVVLIAGVILVYADRVDQKISILPRYSREHSMFYKPFTSVVKTIFPSLRGPEDHHNDNTEFVTTGSGKEQIIKGK